MECRSVFGTCAVRVTFAAAAKRTLKSRPWVVFISIGELRVSNCRPRQKQVVPPPIIHATLREGSPQDLLSFWRSEPAASERHRRGVGTNERISLLLLVAVS